MNRTCRAAVSVLIALLATLPVQAATLLECTLVPDGSASPPGDRIDCALYLLPQETKLTVTARVLRIVGDDAKAELVNARKRPGQTNSTPFSVVQPVVRSDSSPLAKVSLVIPYEELDLPMGVHRIAAEVRVMDGDRLVWTQATPVTLVTVSNSVRESLNPPTAVSSAPFRQTTQALVASKGPQGKAVLDRRWLSIGTDHAPAESKPGSSKVRIPGGFARETLSSGKPAADAPRDPVEADAMSLRNIPWYPLAEVRSKEERTVYFATNRVALEMGEGDQVQQFGQEVGPDLKFGSCVVNIPVTHCKGELEQPVWLGVCDRQKHFLIESSLLLAPKQLLGEIGEQDVVVFVHGFMNTFESAILRAAQLQYDLEFRGKTVSFSWPSAGTMNAYQHDAENAAKSAKALAEVLRILLDAPTSDGDPQKHQRVHLIAHSMGNRVAMQAFYELHAQGEQHHKRRIGQVILAAPDVGATMFNNLLPMVTSQAEQVTYYFCNRDAALRTSQRLNYYEPVGLMPYFDRDLATISADGTDTSFLGHGYYASSEKVLFDMQLLLMSGLSPDRRMPPLAGRAEVFGRPYWSFTRDSVSAAQP